MTVLKRDGAIKDFDESKIKRAILKAAKSVKAEISDETLSKMVAYVVNKVKKLIEPISIDSIQDAVEDSLMKYNMFDVERSFRDFRNKRDEERFKRYAVVKEMKEKIDASNVVNQNANLDEYSFGGRKGEMDSAYLKDQALKYYISEKHAKNHINNRVYIHDLDSYILGMQNCLSVPMDELLAEGVHTRQTNIRPAGSANTALQLYAVYFQLQSLQQFGGVAGTHIDWTMVPYIRKSFRKHYITAYLKSLDDFAQLDLMSLMMDDYYEPRSGIWRNAYEHWVDVHKEELEEKLGLKEKDFYFGNSNLNKPFYQSALYDTISEVKQACEGMLHNLNSLQSRSGNQLPFSSVNYGTCTLPEGRLIIKAILDATIKGTGTGQTSIFPCQIFQLKDGINCKKGDPNYDLFKVAIRCTAKRMYPNYVNCDWSNEKSFFEKSQAIKEKVLKSLSAEDLHALASLGDEVTKSLGFTVDFDCKGSCIITMNKDPQPVEMASTMGCRTYSAFDINFDEDYFRGVIRSFIDDKGKLPRGTLISGTQKDGRGNIAPATIILPTLAMEAKKKSKDNPEHVVDCFMDILEKAISDAKDELIERYNWICAQDPRSAAFMWSNHTFFGYNKAEGIQSAFKHGTLAIGQVGLAECLRILIGEDQCSEKGMELAKRIEQLYKDKCAEYKKHYRLNFGVYFTPAENLANTSFQKFYKKYGKIENITGYTDENGEWHERGYFTNSMHVSVFKDVSPFEKIDIESQLTSYSAAGCITYVEIGDNAMNNLDALEQIILYAKKKDIPYFALNVRLSDCNKCGYSGYIGYEDPCPVCGADHDEWISDFARITGYLSTKVKYFNRGKQLEVKDRFVHINKLSDWK